MHMSRLEFQGMGEVASPKSIDAGVEINAICGYGDNDELIYDSFINPKYKVSLQKISEHVYVLKLRLGQSG